ncbi:hypothetical protein [Lysobacter silvisoli]|uniref:Uncharacterized protein n=1 Tax=Lysobacter silvisoli TaxID=2293254 RepID=A0A371K2J9_9GAMM|nr:hypothetical protein [Lysobacter silvisoli]RDZ28149.1 hypothetical protein DX914_03120 [Lysobacter silvisoli]
MADYLKALNAGVAAAKKADANFLAINLVIHEASKQLSEATGQRLRLSKATATKRILPAPLEAIGLGATASLLMSASIRKAAAEIPYDALVLTVAGVPNGQLALCEWKEAQEGFPVSLKFSGKELTCRDKRSLEAGLMSVLSDADNGRQIDQLLRKAEIAVQSGEPNIIWVDEDEDLSPPAHLPRP